MATKVGVLRGGPSHEHEVSLKTGESVLNHLPKHKYTTADIFISKNGEWFLDGEPSYPEKVFRNVDVIFNALHGQYGEDGKVQQLLETFGIPFTGSDMFSSAVGMNKAMSRESFRRDGLLLPRAVLITNEMDPEEAAKMVFQKIGPNWVVKPASAGSSVGVSIVKMFKDLPGAIAEAFKYDNKVLVEEFIKGREVTAGVVEGFRGQNLYSLPTIEILTPNKFDFFDYQAKYGGEACEMCPANFDVVTKRAIENLAKRAHQSIGARHYSRTDMIVTPKGKVYVLEINTLPGLTAESLIPKAIKAVGASYPDFLDHLIRLALKK